MWKSAKFNEELRKEMLEEASSFVFGVGREQRQSQQRDAEATGHYLRDAQGLFVVAENTKHGSEMAGPLFGCFADGDHGAEWLYNPVRRSENKDVKERERPGGIGREFRYRVDQKHGAEIFLNSFGSGIVTVTLVREDRFPDQQQQPLVWGELLDFVYHLSHLKYRVPMNWRIEEPKSSSSSPRAADAAAAAAASAAAGDGDRSSAVESGLGEYPVPVTELGGSAGAAALAAGGAKAAIEYFQENGVLWRESSGSRDGSGGDGDGYPAMEAVRTYREPFTWAAVFREWLAPVRDEIEGEQKQLMMYTVVEFPGEGAEFGSAGAAGGEGGGYEAALVAMAELEEGSHAPVARRVAEERIERLTECHMVAASPMGVAHFVSRQAGVELEYDKDRAQRILVKYFASTLAAYFQWIGLNHYERRAVAALRREEGSQSQVVRLSDEVAWFVASANLTAINRRDSHNRYYERLRRAYRTEAGMVGLHRTLRDLGWSLEAHDERAAQVQAQNTLEQSREILKEVRQAQELLHETQKELHHSEQRAGNLELFIVLVYVLEMAHILGEMTHAKHGFSLVMAVAGTVVGLVLVVLIVKKKPKGLHDWIGEKGLVPLAMAMLVVYFVGLLVPVWVPELQQPHAVVTPLTGATPDGKSAAPGH